MSTVIYQATFSPPVSGEVYSFAHELATSTSGYVVDGSSTTNDSGIATFTLNNLAAPAAYNFTAYTSGDSNYFGSSGVVTGIIIKAHSTTTLIVTGQ